MFRGKHAPRPHALVDDEDPSPANLPGLHARLPVDETPTCVNCASSDSLVFESVELLLDSACVQPPSWDVEFWCGACESYYGMLTTRMPDDRQAVRLAAENPHYVRYPGTGEQPTTRTKVARSARTTVATGAGSAPPASAGSPQPGASYPRGFPGGIVNSLE